MEDERVSKGILQRVAERGEWFGRTPYGYRMTGGNLIIDENEADVVVDIYDMFYKGGIGVRDIARKLNAKGIKRKNKQWYAGDVQRLLNNPVYYGKIRFMGKVYEGKHKPILHDKYKMPGDYAKSIGVGTT